MDVSGHSTNIIPIHIQINQMDMVSLFEQSGAEFEEVLSTCDRL
jgi:hypothetical protein